MQTIIFLINIWWLTNKTKLNEFIWHLNNIKFQISPYLFQILSFVIFGIWLQSLVQWMVLIAWLITVCGKDWTYVWPEDCNKFRFNDASYIFKLRIHINVYSTKWDSKSCIKPKMMILIIHIMFAMPLYNKIIIIRQSLHNNHLLIFLTHLPFCCLVYFLVHQKFLWLFSKCYVI